MVQLAGFALASSRSVVGESSSSVIASRPSILAMDALLAAITQEAFVALLDSQSGSIGVELRTGPFAEPARPSSTSPPASKRTWRVFDVVQSLNRQQQNTRGFRGVNRSNLGCGTAVRVLPLRTVRRRSSSTRHLQMRSSSSSWARGLTRHTRVGRADRLDAVDSRVGSSSPSVDLTGQFGQLTRSLVAADRAVELLEIEPEARTAPRCHGPPACDRQDRVRCACRLRVRRGREPRQRPRNVEARRGLWLAWFREVPVGQ